MLGDLWVVLGRSRDDSEKSQRIPALAKEVWNGVSTQIKSQFCATTISRFVSSSHWVTCRVMASNGFILRRQSKFQAD